MAPPRPRPGLVALRHRRRQPSGLLCSWHLDSAEAFELTPVVAINHFSADTDAEVQVVRDYCDSREIPAVLNRGWADGGEGAQALATKVVEVVDSATPGFKPVYDWQDPVKTKVEKIATTIYGARCACGCGAGNATSPRVPSTHAAKKTGAAC